MSICVPCYCSQPQLASEDLRGIRIKFPGGSGGFRGVPGGSASSCKKRGYAKPQFWAWGTGVPPALLALLKLKKGKRANWMALAKLFGVRGVHVNVPCKGGMRLRATHSAWYLEFYARTFF